MSDKNRITIVSGLPRSGTSMMMKMLEAGGLPALVDNIRKADEDNPRGYYEFEPVKKTKNDSSWLQNAGGKVVKMVSLLLRDLPADYRYKVVFMRRDMNEILASQTKMLKRSGKPVDDVANAEMSRIYDLELKRSMNWLASQPNFDVIYVYYNELLSDPRAGISELNDFLGGSLNIEAMAAVIDTSLYRNRKS